MLREASDEMLRLFEQKASAGGDALPVRRAEQGQCALYPPAVARIRHFVAATVVADVGRGVPGGVEGQRLEKVVVVVVVFVVCVGLEVRKRTRGEPFDEGGTIGYSLPEGRAVASPSWFGLARGAVEEDERRYGAEGITGWTPMSA